MRKVVRSPYFNQREDVIRLMDYIADNINKPDLMGREKAFQYVFPNEIFNMQTLRYAMSFLMNVLRQYLIIDELEMTGAVRRLYLNAALKRRNCEEILEKELPEAFAENEKQPLRNSSYHLTDFYLKIEEFNINLTQKRNAEVNIEGIFDAFSAHHAFLTLKLGCSYISYKNFTGRETEFYFLKEVLEKVNDGFFDQFPAILLWYHVYKCLESTDNEANFQKVKDILPTIGKSVEPNEMMEIYLSAINFCIKNINKKSDSAYLREAFDLYKSGIHSGALMPNGVLTRYTYSNILVLTMKLNENEWAKHFLDEYHPYLAEKERENTYQFNLAFYYYHIKDYDSALNLLQKVVHFNDTLYNLDARRILVRIFYETNAYAALDSQLESYKAYLRRHKEIGYHREHHNNFILMVGKMMTTDLSNPENKRKLKEKIQIETAIADKEWLLKQLT